MILVAQQRTDGLSASMDLRYLRPEYIRGNHRWRIRIEITQHADESGDCPVDTHEIDIDRAPMALARAKAAESIDEILPHTDPVKAAHVAFYVIPPNHHRSKR